VSQNKLLKERIEKYFLQKQETDLELLRRLTLIIYSIESGSDNDLYMLAKFFPDNFMELIDFFDGDIIKPPSKSEYKKSAFLAIIYYFREIYRDKNGNPVSWKEIKNMLSLPEAEADFFSSIVFSKKINEIKDKLNVEAVQLCKKLKKMDDLDIDTFVSEVQDNGRKRKKRKQ
jgi:hypothetical protein